MNNYVVATIKQWNIENFHKYRESFKGNWVLINQKADLTLERLRTISPRYVFFPHWSWMVPREVIDEFECVCFHMADVPYGRGGSPLQNLIIRGHRDTKLSALKMVQEADAGPVYIKRELSLSGSAGEIFLRCSDLTFQMIAEIVSTEPVPSEQSGEAILFKRRTPAESVLPEDGELHDLYDFIRMLDADTYPKAFIEYGNFRIEFEGAEISGPDTMSAKVKITR